MRKFQIYFCLMIVQVILYCIIPVVVMDHQFGTVQSQNCLFKVCILLTFVSRPYTNNVVQKLNHSRPQRTFQTTTKCPSSMCVFWDVHFLKKYICKCARHSFNLKRQTACRISQEDRTVPNIYEGPRVDYHTMWIRTFRGYGSWNSEEDQDPHCVKSRTGHVICVGGSPIIWSSKLQSKVASSTMEAQ